MKGFYFIENSIDEWHSAPKAYFETLDDAKKAMKNFSDWYCDWGTGKIFFQPFGTELGEFGCYHKLPREFVCKGLGIGKDGKVEFSDKEF